MSYLKNVTREGNILRFETSDCGIVEIEICCAENPPSPDDIPPDNVVLPDGVDNPICALREVVIQQIKSRFANFIVTVYPAYETELLYVVPYVAAHVNEYNYPFYYTSPLLLLAAKWYLEGIWPALYANSQLPSSGNLTCLDEAVYCNLNVPALTEQFRQAVINRLLLSSDPICTPLAEFINTIPFGQLAEDSRRQVIFAAEGTYACQEIDCAANACDPVGVRWKRQASASGWQAYNGNKAIFNSENFQTFNDLVVTNPRVEFDVWRGRPVDSQNRVYAMSIFYEFTEPCDIRSFAIAYGTGSTNTQIGEVYVRRQGSVVLERVIARIDPIAQGQTFPTIVYEAGVSGASEILSVVEFWILAGAGGGAPTIQWAFINNIQTPYPPSPDIPLS